ncbi:hypothetical protein EON83_23995 [bacterium]|nr:MAG: hypothetical protein EON83_23995 [bacterium]
MKSLVGSVGLRSMRNRMTALFALLVAVLMIGVVLGMIRLERRRATARVDEILQLALERAQHEAYDEADPKKTLVQNVQSEQGEIAAGQVALWVVQGERVLWSSQQDAPPNPHTHSDWRARTLVIGSQSVIIARHWEPEEEELRATTRELVGLGFLVVTTTAILAWLLVGLILSPIVRLAHQAQNATLQGVSVRLLPPSSDVEMNYLTGTLNDLLTRLEHQAQERGHFYAAASHELRTPIQVLLGEIEVARSRPRSIEEHEEVLFQVQQDAEKMAELVQDLLQLNALEMRQNLAAKEEINVAFWIERAIEQQSQRIEARSLSLDVQLQDLLIDAPPSHVEVLLRNLVENATKYSDSNSVIRINLTSEVDGVQFEISNSCEMPAVVHFDEWFVPFFRTDATRSSQMVGNGLGLPICRELCTANGWDISLHTDGTGLTVRVKF